MRGRVGVGALAALLLLASCSGNNSSVTERAAQPGAPDVRSLSSKLIPSDDLPPPGTRSLFDHLIAQNDGLPYPFEKLVELLRRQNPSGEAPVVLMIPDGRSLLKASADYRHPRVLVAADFQAPNNNASLGLAPRGQLFLGFVEDASEIEVLSYNEAAGRFEFQLVQDYRADGARRIVYARRAICTTCHQGGAPIFPQRPWNETNGQPDTAAQIALSRQQASYLGLPPSVPLGVPERFDELTDVGNFIPVAQKAWIDGCKSADCRRQMLKLALQYLWNPAEFSADSPAAMRLRELQAAGWPANGIAVPESDLPNRDPLAEKQGFTGWLRGLFASAPEPGAIARDNEDLEAFDKLPKLPAALDPLTPRAPKRVLAAADIDGVYGLAALLSESDFQQLEQAAGHDQARLLAAVDALAPALFEPAPFRRVNMVNALRAVLGQPALAYCCLDTTEMSPPVAAAAPRVQIAEGSPLKHYEQYCFACHRGNPAKRLDFMSGNDEAAVLSQIKAKPEIRDALDWQRYKDTPQANKLMPPPDSPQHASLVEAMKAQPKLLEQMSAVVPGLFDF